MIRVIVVLLTSLSVAATLTSAALAKTEDAERFAPDGNHPSIKLEITEPTPGATVGVDENGKIVVAGSTHFKVSEVEIKVGQATISTPTSRSDTPPRSQANWTASFRPPQLGQNSIVVSAVRSTGSDRPGKPPKRRAEVEFEVEIVDAIPPILSGEVVVTEISDRSAQLSWEPAIDNYALGGYEVAISGRSSIDVPADQTSLRVEELEPSTDYIVSVVAVDSAGNQSDPVVVEFTTAEPIDDIAPTAPGTLTASGRLATSAELSWQASTDDVGVEGYRIFIDGVEIQATAGLTVTIDGLVADQTYDAAVDAFDAAGNVSAKSTTTIPVFVDPNDPCGKIVPATTIDRRSNLTIPPDTATPQYTRPDTSCVNEAVEVVLTDDVRLNVLAVDGAFAYVLPDGATTGTWIDLTSIGQNESINQFWTVGDGSIQEGQTIEYQLSANSTLESMFYNLPIDIEFSGGQIGFYLGFQSRPGETYVWTSSFKSGPADGNVAQVVDFEANGADCSERDDEPGIFDTIGCDTGFLWAANTTYTLRWTVGEQVGTARWFRASIEGPGTAGIQLPSYLVETGATDNPLSVLNVTNFTEQFSGFEDCVPPPSPTGANFGAPQIAGRSLSPSSTSMIWCVEATIGDSTVIPGGRLLQY